jgi:hypothetical protein
MSLGIDVNEVSAVLLADGWHSVTGDSFKIDSYEFVVWGKIPSGFPETEFPPVEGFAFTEHPEGAGPPMTVAGPLTSVLAVRTRA